MPSILLTLRYYRTCLFTRPRALQLRLHYFAISELSHTSDMPLSFDFDAYATTNLLNTNTGVVSQARHHILCQLQLHTSWPDVNLPTNAPPFSHRHSHYWDWPAANSIAQDNKDGLRSPPFLLPPRLRWHMPPTRWEMAPIATAYRRVTMSPIQNHATGRICASFPETRQRSRLRPPGTDSTHAESR